ncbi:MAG: pyruvate formate lyase family protein [Eubacteriales bacterium]
MSEAIATLKTPGNLSPRVKFLRDYFFEGTDRDWNNEFRCFTTGTDWDVLYDETPYYIVPETFAFHKTFTASALQAARVVHVDDEFWQKPLVVRKAEFLDKVMTEHMPCVILEQDLLAGANFNTFTSMCLTKSEQKKRDKLLNGKNGVARAMKWFHDHGYGNSGATSGHIIADYKRVLEIGFSGIYKELEDIYDTLTEKEKKTREGAQIAAMMIAAKMPKKLAEKYAQKCTEAADAQKDSKRKAELVQMAENLANVPWKPAKGFYEAVQSLWMAHMLIMSDENYPGPGVSFGRLDQILYPYYQESKKKGMTDEFAKEILGCFWFHCNTVYDAQIRVGANQGITAGFGQLFNLSGMGAGGKDMTNELTYLLLDMIDDMSPILEPKPNVRLHQNSPDKLMDKVIDMVLSSQGAPFLLNFDERSMAGMLRQAKIAHMEEYINEDNVHEYASVGCLENTMVGNDRSGTVDNNLNLLKAVELAMNDGRDMIPYVNEMTGKAEPIKRDGIATGTFADLNTWGKFFEAYKKQTAYIVKKIVDLYEMSEALRAEFAPTPYLSTLIRGCAKNKKDITQGGAEINTTTIEAVTFATTVDSLLAIKYLVYDKKMCSLEQLTNALKANWEGSEYLQAVAKNKAPKYGRDEQEADMMAQKVMDIWTDETWKHKTKSTNRIFRPGMLSWNYWVGDGFVMAASADGRKQGQFLSNAICPSNGADTKGPTANANSVGVALGGKAEVGDYMGYKNSLPNGASHTITFSASLLKNKESKEKFKAYLKGYIKNGGTALQINILDSNMLRDAQKHPDEYKHLLVRVTGYNAYFASIGRALQDEIIARQEHQGM